MSSVTRSPAAMELTADTMFSVAASLTVRIAQFYNYKISWQNEYLTGDWIMIDTNIVSE